MTDRVRLDGLRLALASDTYAPQLNGVTRTLRRLVEEATARGAEVRVYTPEAPRSRPDEAIRRFPSVPFWGYPELRLAWPRVSTLVDEWTTWRPDLVHAATPFGVGLAARRAAQRLQVPFATSYHTSLSQYAAFYGLGAISQPGWRFLRWFHNSGATTWCPTRAVCGELEAHGFRGTAVWSRGVDTRAFAPSWRSLEYRRSLGILDEDFVLLYVGRLAREKGLDQLLEAARVLGARDPAVRLMLVGDGPYEGVCRQRAPSGTIMTGTLSGHELSTAFASGDLFVFPSTTDTFGNVLLEAMASGLPVIGADCEVTRERLDGGSGLVFDAASLESLTGVIEQVRHDDLCRRDLANRGLEVAQASTWESVFDRLFADYRRLAGLPSAPQAATAAEAA